MPKRVAVGREWSDHIHVRERQREPGWENADDHVRLGIDAHRLAADIGGASKLRRQSR